MPIKKEKKSKERATCGLLWYKWSGLTGCEQLMKINQWQENQILINYSINQLISVNWHWLAGLGNGGLLFHLILS